jgi:hypothetical protein
MSRCFAILSVVLAGAAAPAFAATISGDTFTIAIATDNGDTPLLAPTDGVAGSGDPENFSFDILAFEGDLTAEVGFLSETVIQFAAFRGGTDDFTNLVYSVSGLDYLKDGSPAPILGVKLINEAALRAEFQSEDFTSPTIAFTDDSFTATFAFMSSGTFADALAFQFQIFVDEPPPVAPIPLPAAAWMLGAAFASLGLVRPRRLGAQAG